MGALESGQSLLAGVLAKLPAEQRAQAEAIFKAAEAKDAVTLLGDSALARSDYSRNLDELRTKEQAAEARQAELESWFELNQSALVDYKTNKAEFDRLKAGGGPTPTPTPTPAAPKAYDPEEAKRIAREEVNAVGFDYVNVSAWLVSTAMEHMHRFKEPLNTQELMQNPKLGKPVSGQPGRVYSLEDAYKEKFGTKISELAAQEETKRIEQLVQTRLSEERAKYPGQQPYPLRGQQPAALDVLANKDANPANFTADAAAAEYERLQSQRATG